MKGGRQAMNRSKSWGWRSMRFGLAIALLAGTGLPSWAFTADEKVAVAFSTNWDVGIGREVFVVGNHTDLGDWNPLRARKLRWTSGNVWTGAVAVTAGSHLEYKYIVRTNAGAAYCAAENVVWMPDPNLAANLPARDDPPYSGKTIYYYSAWTNAFLLHRTGGSETWTDTPMLRVGPGRHAGEYLYRVDGIGTSGDLLTFVPHGFFNGEEAWDNTPVPGVLDYYTRLDAFLLQDGHVYGYWPPANRTDSSINSHFIVSSYTPQIPSRNIRVYTPRNYTLNTNKHYPVLYLHDGQNTFRPGGIYGCWYAEDAADHMISFGMMRESILVAIDNTDERLREYLAPTDSYQSNSGTADRYLAFVVHDVMPFVNASYRTLTGPENTGVLGSSFGGVASLYFGMASNVFGRIGPMSTSFWAIPNYLAQRIDGQDTSGLRIYTDYGTMESEPNYQAMWSVYDKFMADGYVPNDSLRIEVGCGHEHSEWAWALRVPDAMAFLFNAREEPNEILLRELPLRLEAAGDGDPAAMSYLALKGWNYVLQRAGMIRDPTDWAPVATGRLDALMWSVQDLSIPLSSSGGHGYFRIQAQFPGP